MNDSTFNSCRYNWRRAGLIRAVRLSARLALPCLCVLLLGACSSDSYLSFLNPQGPVASAERTDFLIFVGVLLIFVAGPIFLVLPFLAWRYRYNNKSARYTPKWTLSHLLEVATWGGPILIVIVLGVLLWNSTHSLDPYKPLPTDKPPLHVQVIGYDWKWLFIYPKQQVASVGVMPMIADRPVALDITSATVMQSFFIPSLGSQIYAMGGMVTQLHLQANQPGRFLGENTMYSGDGFHTQQFDAVAMTPHQFHAWIHKARTHGTPMDSSTLKTIAQRNTRTQLAAALGQADTAAKGLYFSDVSPQLFSAVVGATLAGTPANPESPSTPGGKTRSSMTPNGGPSRQGETP